MTRRERSTGPLRRQRALDAENTVQQPRASNVQAHAQGPKEAPRGQQYNWATVPIHKSRRGAQNPSTQGLAPRKGAAKRPTTDTLSLSKNDQGASNVIMTAPAENIGAEMTCSQAADSSNFPLLPIAPKPSLQRPMSNMSEFFEWNYMEKIKLLKEILGCQQRLKNAYDEQSEGWHTACADFNKAQAGLKRVYKEFWTYIGAEVPDLVNATMMRLAEKVDVTLQLPPDKVEQNGAQHAGCNEKAGPAQQNDAALVSAQRAYGAQAASDSSSEESIDMTLLD
ncbi:MAG: hypothetical protein Q9227_008376 [Pyrenula ochraceoflavens]